MMMNIKVLSKKLVKPSTPTPPNLKGYNFSFPDQCLPPTEVGILLFYSLEPDRRRVDLEGSLAKVLVQFYPLAGRFVFEDQLVDCSDQGAELIEAEAPEAELASLIAERNLENLFGFLPRQHQSAVAAPFYPILSTQVTRLTNCNSGGVVIGISISHKIFDASSMATFLAAWSAAAGGDSSVAVVPRFDSAVFFPGSRNNNNNNNSLNVSVDKFTSPDGLSVKRFSFDEKSITSLRSKLRPTDKQDGRKISRVSVVSALISRAMIGLDRAKFGRFRDCLVSMAVNMRGRTTPPLHNHACGNLTMLSVVRYCSSINAATITTTQTETETETESKSQSQSETTDVHQQLVDLIREGTRKTISKCSGILSLDDDDRNRLLMKPMKTVGTIYLSGEASVTTFSDFSKFAFYEADFGWGKPVWASIVPQPGPFITVLMNDKQGDGIEAWVHLNKSDMALFEEDEQIKMFAT